MSDHTLAELREELADTAGVSGRKGTECKLVKEINSASRELMDMHDWPDIVERYRIETYDPYIVLPFHLRKITHAILDKHPVQMRSPWFEFMNHGTGEIEDDQWCRVLIQRNRTPVFRQIPKDGGPYRLRVLHFTDETTFPDYCPKPVDPIPDPYEPKTNIRGYVNNDWVYTDNAQSQHIQGEDIRIDSGTPFGGEGNINFNFIESFNKPYTNGRIELRAFNEETEAEILLAVYHPYERTPSYRMYTLPGLKKCERQTLTVRARRDYVPSYRDDDIISFGSIEALRMMMIAQHKKKNQKLQDYLNYRNAAKELQLEHEASSEMKHKVPAMNPENGWSNGPDSIEEVY